MYLQLGHKICNWGTKSAIGAQNIDICRNKRYYLLRVRKMISELSKRISLFLCRNNIINYEDIEIYKYGFETICSTFLGFIITVIIGLVFKMFLLSIFYYIMFVTIRQFTGGYHAKSYFKCNLTFSIVTTFVFSFTKLVVYTQIYIILYHILFLILSFMIVWRYIPVENENKPLDQEQKKKNRSIGIALTGTVSILSCAIYSFSVQTSILIAFTQLSIAVLIVIAQIEKGSERDAEDEKDDT